MEVIEYFIYAIFTKDCTPNYITQFCLKIMYIMLVEFSYNFCFTYLCLNAYIFQLYYLYVMVR
jgi:hypothetical protein